MAPHPKRQRNATADDATTSRSAPSQSPTASPPPAAPTISSLRPWPKREGKRIPPTRTWDADLKMVANSEACLMRPIRESWDDYDTLFYNAWLGVEVVPTRFADRVALQRMGIRDEVERLLAKIGLGTMATQQYDLYPDLVRQFLATVRVYYMNEAVRNALAGTLTFLIRGIRYRISIPDLCSIYGFEPHATAVTPLPRWDDTQVFWSHFGNKRYDSKTSTQTDVRHPVLRCLARLLATTILCKMEPGKMRVTELILLSHAIGDLCAGFDPTEAQSVNLGAVFADHLISLKTKPFAGTAKKVESVGSLLTPIFQYCGIILDESQIVTTRTLMSEKYLQNARWVKPHWIWCYSDEMGEQRYVQLPLRELTDIGDDPSRLQFQPDHRLFISVPPTRLRRGSSSRAAGISAEDTQVPVTSGGHSPRSTPPMEFTPAPTVPMEPAVFQQYVVDSFQRVWDAIASLSRCGCVRPSRRRSASPPVGPSHAEESDAASEEA